MTSRTAHRNLTEAYRAMNNASGDLPAIALNFLRAYDASTNRKYNDDTFYFFEDVFAEIVDLDPDNLDGLDPDELFQRAHRQFPDELIEILTRAKKDPSAYDQGLDETVSRQPRFDVKKAQKVAYTHNKRDADGAMVTTLDGWNIRYTDTETTATMSDKTFIAKGNSWVLK